MGGKDHTSLGRYKEISSSLTIEGVNPGLTIARKSSRIRRLLQKS
jgi:hypothetical protein